MEELEGRAFRGMVATRFLSDGGVTVVTATKGSAVVGLLVKGEYTVVVVFEDVLESVAAVQRFSGEEKYVGLLRRR